MSQMAENISIFGSINKTSVPEVVTPLWFVILDKTQLGMVCVGFVANVVTVITLQKNGEGFQKSVSYFAYCLLCGGTNIYKMFSRQLISHS